MRPMVNNKTSSNQYSIIKNTSISKGGFTQTQSTSSIKPKVGVVVKKQDNIVETQSKGGSGTNLGGRFNFAQKFGTSNGVFSNMNSNQPKPTYQGSNTNNKITSTSLYSNSVSTKVNLTNNISQSQGKPSYGVKNQLKPIQNYQVNQNIKSSYQEVDDIRPFKGG